MSKSLSLAAMVRLRGRSSCGFTLLELLLVMALVGILASLASWGSQSFARGWKLKRAGHQLLEDLKAVQARAEMSGSLTMHDGALIMQHFFLVFDPAAQSYRVSLWRDLDGNGVADAGEATQLWQKSLPPGISFNWAAGIDRRACSNSNSPPGSVISFASPVSLPCATQPCIKFDQHGFSVMGPGAIYLSEGEQSLAITGTRPGYFTMCEWDGERWR